MLDTTTDINLVDTRQWEALLASSQVASWFQSRECYDFFDSVDGHTPFIVAVERDGELRALATGVVAYSAGLARPFTSRAIINGGPLLPPDITDDELRLLLRELRVHLRRHAVYVETRNFNDYSPWRPIFEECGFRYVPHYNYHIDTHDLPTVMQHLGGNRRRELKKSLDTGATIDETADGIADFYAILSDLYRTKVRTPLPDISFFQQLASLSSGHLFIVRDSEGRVVGGQACVVLQGRVAYDWYCCGLDHEYKQLHPSVVASFAGIKYATENGCPRFDMMGAGAPGDGGYGVRKFKAQFGGELVEHGRFLHICKPLVYFAAKLLLNLKKKL